MKAKSCISIHLDPYRAGAEIGQALSTIKPEVIFLFSSIHYNGSPELLEAIYAELDSDKTLLIGATGGGVYEKNRVADVGVSAVGINTFGKVSWHLVCESNIGLTPYDTTAKCIREVNNLTGRADPVFHFFVADYRTDSSEINRAFQELTKQPAVGGLAGDNCAFRRCFLFKNKEVLTDCIAILTAVGDIAFDIRFCHDMQPLGKVGRITECQGTEVQAIDDMPAMDFVERELGKPFQIIDEGIMTFQVSSTEDNKEKRLRSILMPEEGTEDRWVKLFGSIDHGDFVQICLTSTPHMMESLADVGKSLSMEELDPIAGIIVSCCARKQALGTDIEKEVTEIIKHCPSIQGIAGFPSHGEFSPVLEDGKYSKSHFHNMTFVLLTVGDTVA